MRAMSGAAWRRRALRDFYLTFVASRPEAAVKQCQSATRCRFLPTENEGQTVATEVQAMKQARLLVVEDDVLIRMLLTEMVDEIGYTIAAEAVSVDEALKATRKNDFDLAILDTNLKGRSVSPVADALVARDIRFVFVTGYDDHGLSVYRDRPTLKKPFQIEALKGCCKSVLSSH